MPCLMLTSGLLDALMGHGVELRSGEDTRSVRVVVWAGLSAPAALVDQAPPLMKAAQQDLVQGTEAQAGK